MPELSRSNLGYSRKKKIEIYWSRLFSIRTTETISCNNLACVVDRSYDFAWKRGRRYFISKCVRQAMWHMKSIKLDYAMHRFILKGILLTSYRLKCCVIWWFSRYCSELGTVIVNPYQTTFSFGKIPYSKHISNSIKSRMESVSYIITSLEDLIRSNTVMQLAPFGILLHGVSMPSRCLGLTILTCLLDITRKTTHTKRIDLKTCIAYVSSDVLYLLKYTAWWLIKFQIPITWAPLRHC